MKEHFLKNLFLVFLILPTIFLVSGKHIPFQVQASDNSLNNKFIWIAKIVGQFTDEEYQRLAAQFSVIIIGNPHARWKHESAHEAARKIVAINPAAKVFVYWSTSKVHKYEESEFLAQGFQDAWYLRDRNDNKVPYYHNVIAGYFVDLTNASFRAWAINTLDQWLDAAPYAGIAFDEADPIELHLRDDQLGLLSEEKRLAWNNARKLLLQAAKNRFSGKLIFYNGIKRKGLVANQNLDLLDTADGIMNEQFCYAALVGNGWRQPSGSLLEIIQTQLQIAGDGKIVWQKTNYGDSFDGNEQGKIQMGRYCYAAFLLGYVPGRTYYKYGPGYYIKNTMNELAENAREIDLPFGNPLGQYGGSNWLFSRRFANGRVYVNLSDETKTVTLPETLTLMNGGVVGQTYDTGQNINLPARDALFFLKNPPLPGDLDGDRDVDIYDYNLLVSDFGKTGSPGWIKADIDKNGKVDIFDYNVLVENFGK